MTPLIGIQNLAEIAPLAPQQAAGGTAAANGFEQVLAQVNQTLHKADTAAVQFASGKGDLTDAVLAATQADTNFGLLMAVRNRALNAYQQIMSMNV